MKSYFLHAVCLGVIRVVSLLYLASFDRIIKKCKLSREIKAKAE